MVRSLPLLFFFFFNDTATTEIYTLSLHDALPIYLNGPLPAPTGFRVKSAPPASTAFCESIIPARSTSVDRKSTRLNSSHSQISYAVFCLKKKNGGFGTDRRLATNQKRDSETTQRP